MSIVERKVEDWKGRLWRDISTDIMAMASI
jgi:hypothetical protein